MEDLLEKLQHSANTVGDIIMLLIHRNILGYLNFGILNDFKKFEAFDDENVIQELDKYKRKHNAFILLNFSNIIRAFKERPNLAPPSLIGLPEITVELEDEWKGKSFYSWNEILQDFTNWPDHLLIKEINTNCVIIVYYVMPFFLAQIVADLDNGAIVKKFAAVGAVLHISLETQRLGREEGEWIKNRVEHAMAVIKLSTPAQLQGGSCNKKPTPQPAPVPPDGGYHDKIFLSPPPKDLQCPVCELTLREPHKFVCCGTIVCNVCIQHTNTSKACPHCHSNSLTLPVHDKRLEQEIMSLKVKCTNGDCEWRGELVDYNNHITDKCPNRVVQCQYNCGLYFMASEVSVHEKEECTKRPYEVVVQYYEKQLEATKEFYEQQVEKMMEEKSDETEKKYAASMKMNEMKNIEIDCLKEKIQTSTSVMEATGSDSSINLKSKDELGVTVAKTEVEIRAKKTSSQEDPTILSLRAQVQLLEANIARMRLELEDKKRMSDVVHQHKEGQNTLEDNKQTNISHVTHDVPSWYGPLTDLISSSIPPCIRAMTSFTQHRLSGDSWYSPPFYTGPGGYKLQLRVDPNTSTKPKGISLIQQKLEDTHISVCVHLMKGENDDCLGWPFKGSVTVKLLNWIEDKNHFEQSFSTTSAADPQSFSRVTSGVRAPSEMYQRHFISHRELEFNGEKKTHHVMEDVLCFMISSVEVLSNYQSSLVPEWTHPELSLVSYGVLPVYRTVKEFNQLKANDQPIHTDPFYTAQGGYKMIMNVCPNGNGSYRGTYLSVFISLMRGENDHTLSFPINGIFKIQLLNWRQNSGHVEKILQFDESTPERHRLQVTTGEEAAEGYGLLNYLSHDELENSSDYKEYIHNNTLCFKIQFEPTQRRTGPLVPSWCDVMYKNSSTPPCTRTLTRYSEYKRTDSEWDSLPFYSKDKGYKLQLRVYANGRGSSKGTHLSLYVFLLKGEYDDQLQWPFSANITVQLLNWSGDNSHKEKTIPHYKAPLEHRTRVTEGDRTPGGWGYPQFISHSVLESVSSDTRYINEDSVCFRIVNVEVV